MNRFDCPYLVQRSQSLDIVWGFHYFQNCLELIRILHLSHTSSISRSQIAILYQQRETWSPNGWDVPQCHWNMAARNHRRPLRYFITGCNWKRDKFAKMWSELLVKKRRAASNLVSSWIARLNKHSDGIGGTLRLIALAGWLAETSVLRWQSSVSYFIFVVALAYPKRAHVHISISPHLTQKIGVVYRQLRQ